MNIREGEKTHVLVRCPEFKPDNKVWMAASYEREVDTNGKKKYLCSGSWWLECIPYQFNEELLGTKDDPKDIKSLQWGDKCLIWHVTDGWRKCIFVGFNREMAYPWQVIMEPTVDEILAMGPDKTMAYAGTVLKVLKEDDKA